MGAGPRSNEASSTPATVPTEARNLRAKPHATRGINLTWAVPSSNGGSAVLGYWIYRSTSPGTETFLLAVGNITSYRDTANTPGVRYYYKVLAFNNMGQGQLSTESTAIAK